jgi:hypothetical protein
LFPPPGSCDRSTASARRSDRAGDGANAHAEHRSQAEDRIGAIRRRPTLNSLGGQWVNGLEIGQIRRFATEWYQPLERTQTLFGSVYGQIKREPQYVFDGDQRVAEYDVLTEQGGLDLGANFGGWGEIRFGPQYTHYRADPQIALKDFKSATLDEAGVGLRYRLTASMTRSSRATEPRPTSSFFAAFRISAATRT